MSPYSQFQCILFFFIRCSAVDFFSCLWIVSSQETRPIFICTIFSHSISDNPYSYNIESKPISHLFFCRCSKTRKIISSLCSCVCVCAHAHHCMNKSMLFRKKEPSQACNVFCSNAYGYGLVEIYIRFRFFRVCVCVCAKDIWNRSVEAVFPSAFLHLICACILLSTKCVCGKFC